MKERLQGVLAGVLVGALCAGGVAIAKSGTENIDVTYDNIKVYKDNVLCELKDSNGSVIEPFIYNGTTYMPVRGTANIAGMDVTWDGASKSVYLWDNLVASGTYLLDVCWPYAWADCWISLSSDGESFEMSGEKYSNGFELKWSGYALFNLNSKYSTIECTIGHSYDSIGTEKSVSFIVDGKTVKTVELEPEEMPKTVSIPVSYGLQLKIIANDIDNNSIGIGNITVK